MTTSPTNPSPQPEKKPLEDRIKEYIDLAVTQKKPFVLLFGAKGLRFGGASLPKGTTYTPQELLGPVFYAWADMARQYIKEDEIVNFVEDVLCDYINKHFDEYKNQGKTSYGTIAKPIEPKDLFDDNDGKTQSN